MAHIKIEKHLGGSRYITHIDEKSLDYLINKFNIKSFLDIGCGPGGMVEHALLRNLKATGIDGDVNCLNYSKNIIIHDFVKGKINIEDYDMGWCVEFLEHIEEKYLENVFDVFSKCNRILISHAIPGMRGHHHVNCQIADYWINLFDKNGFNYDKESTIEIKKISSMKRNFIRSNGILFVKK